jgi:hypothetical protein
MVRILSAGGGRKRGVGREGVEGEETELVVEDLQRVRGHGLVGRKGRVPGGSERWWVGEV